MKRINIIWAKVWFHTWPFLAILAVLLPINMLLFSPYLAQKRDGKIADAKANAIVIRTALENWLAEIGLYGEDGKYEYKADGTRPTDTAKDPVPTFQLLGKTQMDFKVTIKEGGTSYDIEVFYPAGSSKTLFTGTKGGALEVAK